MTTISLLDQNELLTYASTVMLILRFVLLILAVRQIVCLWHGEGIARRIQCSMLVLFADLWIFIIGESVHWIRPDGAKNQSTMRMVIFVAVVESAMLVGDIIKHFKEGGKIWN